MTAIAIWMGREVSWPSVSVRTEPTHLVLMGVNGGYEAPVQTMHTIEMMQRSGSRFI